VDDALGLAQKVWMLGQQGIGETVAGGSGAGKAQTAEQSAQTERAHSHAATGEKFAAGQRQMFRVRSVVSHLSRFCLPWRKASRLDGDRFPAIHPKLSCGSVMA